MFINKFKISGCLLIGLDDKKEITIEEVGINNLILGPNGSGKTTILSELLPIPSNKNHYENGGSKEVWFISSNNRYYFKSSKLNNTMNHTLKNMDDDSRDLIELNGKTMSSAIDERFGLNSNVRDILLGKKPFTEMSGVERKNVILSMVDIDSELLQNTHGQVKKLLNEIKNIIKYNNSKIAAEKNNMINIDNINSDHARITNRIDKLKNLKFDTDMLVDHDKKITMMTDDIKKKLITYKNIRKNIFSNYNNLNKLPNMQTQDNIMHIIDNFTKKINVLEKEIGTLATNSKDVDEASLSDSHLTDLIRQREALNKKINDIGIVTTKIKLTSRKDVVDNYNRINEYRSTIINALDDIISVPEKYNVIDIENELELTEKDLKQKNLEKERMAVVIEHLDSQEPCPKCNNVIVKGYNKVDMDKHAATHTKLINETDKLKHKHEFLKETQINISNNKQQLKTLNTLLNTNNVQLVPDIKTRYIVSDVTGVKGDVIGAIDDINALYQSQNRIIELELLDEEIANIRSIDIDKIFNNNYQLEKKKKEYDILINDRHNVTINLNDLKNHNTLMNKLECLRKEICKIATTLDENLSEHFKKELNLLSSTEIKNLLDEKTAIETKILTVRASQSIVDKSTKDNSEFEPKKKALEEVLNILSPNKGFYKREIRNGMDNIIQQMNYFISEVWETKLELKTSYDELEVTDDVGHLGNEIEQDPLNYTFPVSLHEDGINPDIKELSEGEKEIVNIVFLLIYNKIQFKNEMPAFLDEPGTNFSEPHRNNLYKVINELNSEHDYNQMFLVSHYGELFSKLNDSTLNTINLSKREDLVDLRHIPNKDSSRIVY